MYPVLLLQRNPVLHAFSPLFFGLFTLLFMSAACAAEINPLITPYCISLIRRDTISYPRLFTPQHVGAHTRPQPCCTFHCCSHASQMKAILHSVGAARTQRETGVHSQRQSGGEKRRTPCQEGDVMLPSNDYVG